MFLFRKWSFLTCSTNQTYFFCDFKNRNTKTFPTELTVYLKVNTCVFVFRKVPFTLEHTRQPPLIVYYCEFELKCIRNNTTQWQVTNHKHQHTHAGPKRTYQPITTRSQFVTRTHARWHANVYANVAESLNKKSVMTTCTTLGKAPEVKRAFALLVTNGWLAG